MPALMVGVCSACQQNKHEICANEGACVCALRQHPTIPERSMPSANPVYIPNPGEG
jgi:hypothetical protein